MRRVGFVGPDEEKLLKSGLSLEHVYDECKKIMLSELKMGLYIFVSGGCSKKGIDTICESIADELHLEKEIIKPDIEQWEDKVEGYNAHNPLGTDKGEVIGFDYEKIILKGYKSRNIEIAKKSDKLYCIVPYQYGAFCYHHKDEQDVTPHPVNGGCFTRKVAHKLGKETYLVTIL